MTVTDIPAVRGKYERPKLSDQPGVVALPTTEIGRFMLFTVSLCGTVQPQGSRLHVAASANVIENCNSIIRDMGKNDAWLWLLGDDHVWPGETLMTLLHTMDDHPEIDILVPLVAKRNPPWHLVLYHLLDDVRDENGIQMLRAYEWTEIPEEGVFQVDAAGSAGMLVRRHVLDTLGDPWFNSTPDLEGRQVVMNEDITFCLRAKEAGFNVWATTAATMGHLGIYNVRPVFREGRWGCLTEFSSAEEQFKHLFMPLEDEQIKVLA